MRILILTQWFKPEPEFRGGLGFARQLQALGHEVEVLTGFPNYPGGQLYPGYKVRLFQRELMDGIRVNRVALYPSHDRSALRRIVNYISFAMSAALLGPFLVRKPDVIYVYHPPATVALPAFSLSLFRGAPFVYEVQDIWPDTLRATGMFPSRTAAALLGMWCKLTYKLAARVVVISEGFARKLAERGVPRDKLRVIYNWCADVIRTAAPEPAPGDRFTVVFAGNMGKAQALEAVLDAAALVQRRDPRVHFLFIGGGIEVEALRRKAAELQLANVTFRPPVPVEEIGPVLAAADALLVHLKDDPLFEVTIPSKTQAYLAAGRPIIIAVKGDAAALVERARAGIACRPADPESVAAAVLRLAALPPDERAAMGRRGAEFYARELSIEVGSERLLRVFEEVQPQRPAPQPAV